MKIFYTVSKSGRHKYSAKNKLVLDELKVQGASVISTIEKTYLKDDPKHKKIDDLSEKEEYKFVHHTAIKKAIFLCDGVVIEASNPSFRLGFEAHLALTHQKPVLVLSRDKNYGGLVDHPNFFGAAYTDFTLPDEIEKFLRHVKKYRLRNRFNMFISDSEKAYLKRMAEVNGMSMSNYIRKLIQQDMTEDGS
jgi:predicted DNA binding CopG/RHH family protein